MADSIDRLELLRDMYSEAFDKDTGEQRWDSGCWIRYKMVERVIKRQPSAQRTGRWISADAIFHSVPYYCSECGELTLDTVKGKPRAKYCPNCGAQMEVK